jgi:hypothetical protein
MPSSEGFGATSIWWYLWYLAVGVGAGKVRCHGVVADELETAHADLVRCRAVFIPIAEPEQALQRLAAKAS